MVRFHATLSEDSVFSRYFGTLKLESRIAHQRLERICRIDPARETALVAERGGEIVAVARLSRLVRGSDAEFALLVSDEVQGRGLGRALLEKLLEIGSAWGVQRIVAEILPANARMRRLCARLGFRFEGETGAVKDL